MLLERAIHLSGHFFGHAEHFLIIDVEYPPGIVANFCSGTEESAEVPLSALEGLRLHSSSGLLYHETYQFRSNPSPHDGLGISARNAIQNRFSHLPNPSILLASDFDACRATIDMLLARKWSPAVTLDNVLQLAREYHRTAFNLEHATHAFLILMIVFEALFKKDERAGGKAAKCIGSLLGNTQKACSAIAQEFDGAQDSFREIRNRIAHGDSSLDAPAVSLKYPTLYRYVTDALIRLLALPPTRVDSSKDYYDEIARIANERLALLPRR